MSEFMNPPDRSALIILQARLNSIRVPKKIFSRINGEKSLDILLYRLKKISFSHNLILAIPRGQENDELETWCNLSNVSYFRGSDSNVLERFNDVLESRSENIIFRITADCPFVDPAIVEKCFETFTDSKVDYLRTSSSYPDGLDVEVFTKSALQFAHQNATAKFDREHVTPFIRNQNFYRVAELASPLDLSNIRITLDEPADLVVLNAIAKHFGHFDFHFDDIVKLVKHKPEIFKNNQHLIRNEGSMMSSGEKLWKRAQNSIAGGNMLLSKRPDMFLKSGWPTYFSKTRGCQVWDLDENKYTDISLMGVGTNILGYSHPKVDEAVRKVIEKGNLSTLNAPEEVYLAERLVSLHPWSSKVKFARTGGEANAVAIRLARAATGRQKVAFCGYHGWHDWYLAANLSSADSLNNHLLPGLKFAGVPNELINTSIPFHFNQINELKEIIEKNDLAAVVMEVMRNTEPEVGFLSAVRELTRKNGIALIFDECTSGFRETYGGLHLKYGINPDMATFGKTLGNGYAITAVVGTDSVMDFAQETFISSTFWTERIGSAASLAVLDVMEQEDVFKQMINISALLRDGLTEIASRNSLKITFFGLPTLTRFSFENFDTVNLKTYITREMLKLNYLASNMIYVSLAHTREILEKYFSDLNSILVPIANLENIDLLNLIKDDLATEGFKRLN
jgi:glutamate-1-semialdehyde 2,1-aminomutase